MKALRTAVIGVGYLGEFHAQKYAALPQSELIAVCDTDLDRAQLMAQSLNTQAVTDYTTLIGQVDAVSVVVPTAHHFKVAAFFIQNHIHVLIEKPMTTTIAEAEQLIALAKKHQVTLQVGHIERFNPAMRTLTQHLTAPRFIESTRLSPFKIRGTDVNVVLDVMIHDIDIINTLVQSDIESISASGASVLTPFIDIINARILFKNGCVANVTASRVSPKIERKMRVFQHDCFVNLDLDRKRMSIHRKGDNNILPGVPEITREKFTIEKRDALLDQIASFLDAIQNNTPPVVTGEDGKNALQIAIDITRTVHEHNKQHPFPSH